MTKKWLREAIVIEDKANCDIYAGLELGQNLSEYIKTAKSYTDRQKLISVLKEESDEILCQKNIE